MKRILFIDNDKKFLDLRAGFLLDEGYEVIKATNYEQACYHLDNTWVHLVILDVRLLEEDNPEDKSGLDLALHPKYASIPKVIHTGYPTYEMVREVMVNPGQDLPPAVSFVGKVEGASKLLAEVSHVFNQVVRINETLAIRWLGKQGHLFTYLYGLLATNGEGIRQQADRALELEDLLRRMFYEYQQVTISRVMWQSGGRLGVEVYAYKEGNWQEAYLVTLGDVESFNAEHRVFTEMDEWARLGEGMDVALEARTLHFAATAWSIDALNLEESQPWMGYLEMASSNEVREVIENLLTMVVDPALKNCRNHETSLDRALEHVTGLATADLAPKSLAVYLENLISSARRYELGEVSVFNGRFLIEFPGGRTADLLFPDLTSARLSELYQRSGSFCLCPGGLDLSTVLVGSNGQVCLSNFATIEAAPLLVELAAWEAYTRFETMQVANLMDLYDFERELIGMRQFSGRLSLDRVEPGCRKALSALLTLRASLAENTPGEENTFQAALLFLSLAGLAKTDSRALLTRGETATALHRFLLAGMLAEALDQSPAEASFGGQATTVASAELHFNEQTSEMECNGRSAHLTPTECDLMRLFFQHAGELCTREMIMREVFKYNTPADRTTNQLINANMERLRGRLEDIAGGHEYFDTIRAKGYIFHPKGK
jgi:DNA-binding response OmpR family regulator